MKKESRFQEAKFLAGTLVFALALFVYSMKGILSPLEAGLSPGGDRNPASLESGPTALNGKAGLNGGSGQLETLEWNCKDPKETPKVAGSHFRLKSKYCDKTENPVVKITNRANGYTASVFLAAKGFSTDFIDLQDGENKIAIEWKNPKGELVEREFKVVRQPAQAPGAAAGTGLEGVQNGRTH